MCVCVSGHAYMCLSACMYVCICIYMCLCVHADKSSRYVYIFVYVKSSFPKRFKRHLKKGLKCQCQVQGLYFGEEFFINM